MTRRWFVLAGLVIVVLVATLVVIVSSKEPPGPFKCSRPTEFDSC